MTKLQYRGVGYDNAQHEQLSNEPVDHAYRGQHYTSAPRHEAAAVNTEVELQYRGQHYQHQQAEAAQQVNNG
ncbi:MAG: DUF4278 domain-containing protein [Vulcanococcus sp.]